MKKLYPTEYSEYVYKYSEEYNLDPLLVFAIIKAESNFDPNSVSDSNAMGLMQLVENTAIDVMNSINEEIDISKELFDPETNIRFGCKYFSDLMALYDNNLNLSLAAYNAGMGNVNEWIKEGIIRSDGSDIENIPFKETNNYVRKILRDYNIYLELWGWTLILGWKCSIIILMQG